MTGIITMISNFTVFFIVGKFILKLFITNVADFCLFIYDLCSSLVNGIISLFMKLIISIACSFKDAIN